MLDVTIINGLFQPTCRLLISILVAILKIEIDMVGVIHFPAGYLKKSFINLLFVVVSHLKCTSPRIRTSSCRASHTFACWVPHRANIHRQCLGLLHEAKGINLHPLHYKRVFHCEISIVSVFVVNGKLCFLHGVEVSIYSIFISSPSTVNFSTSVTLYLLEYISIKGEVYQRISLSDSIR